MTLALNIRSPLAAPIVVLVISLLTSATLLETALSKSTAAQVLLDQARAQKAAAQRRIDTAETDKVVLQSNARTLAGWRRRQWIGEEKRMEWIELLQQTAQTLAIQDIRYEFSASKPVAEGAGQDASWRASSMQLSMSGIDELQLLGFLEKIASGASALVVVRRCSLSAAKAPGEALVALDAECVLDWLTIAPPGKPS